MEPKKVIQRMVGDSNRAAISREMGRTNSYTTSLMQRDNPTISIICEVANVTGYDILARSKDSGEELLFDPPKRE